MDENKHDTDTSSQREQYDKAVTTLTHIFDTNFIDPFDVTKAPAKIVNFATGSHATDDIEKSITNCLFKGQDMFESFVRERLEEEVDGSDLPKKIIVQPNAKELRQNNVRQRKQKSHRGNKLNSSMVQSCSNVC